MDPTKIEIYAKPFVVEDDNMEGAIPARVSYNVIIYISTMITSTKVLL